MPGFAVRDRSPAVFCAAAGMEEFAIEILKTRLKNSQIR